MADPLVADEDATYLRDLLCSIYTPGYRTMTEEERAAYHERERQHRLAEEALQRDFIWVLKDRLECALDAFENGWHDCD